MAAGDRKLKITFLEILRESPVPARAKWTLSVENKVGQDVEVSGGWIQWNLGNASVARAKTLETIENEALAQVAANPHVPAHDNLT